MALCVEHDVDLTSLNTLGIRARAHSLVRLTEVQQIEELAQLIPQFASHLILGGGSNVLFRQDFPGLVIIPDFKKVAFTEVSDDEVRVTAGSRMNWHELVVMACDKGLSGIENLALIPGTVGAAPIQNIGAYGVELKDCFESLVAFDLQDHCFRTFSLQDCQFGYRESLFKQKLGRYLICEVTLKLSRKFSPVLTYQPLTEKFKPQGDEKLEPKTVMNAVIEIRQSKLPDPAVLGNAGSFFKNPVVSAEEFIGLQAKYPQIAHFVLPQGKVKLAAGWLIDHLGLKGFRVGGAAVHQLQALVLVNLDNATGDDVFMLSEQIKRRVKEAYNVDLETEVRMVP